MKFETSGDISAPTQYVCESITTGRAIEQFVRDKIDACFAAGVGAFVQDISDDFGRNRQP